MITRRHLFFDNYFLAVSSHKQSGRSIVLVRSPLRRASFPKACRAISSRISFFFFSILRHCAKTLHPRDKSHSPNIWWSGWSRNYRRTFVDIFVVSSRHIVETKSYRFRKAPLLHRPIRPIRQGRHGCCQSIHRPLYGPMWNLSGRSFTFGFFFWELLPRG